MLYVYILYIIYVCVYCIYYIYFFFNLAIPILEINPKKIIGCVQKINHCYSYCNTGYGIAN